MQGSDVTVEGIDGSDLVIKGDGFEEAPKRAEGLHPIYNSAVDNTKIGLAVTQQDNVVRISRASRKEASYLIRVPRSSSVQYNQADWNGGDVAMRDVGGDMEVSMNSGDIKLKNVAGPVVANTVSGDIQVRFAPMRQGPSSISTVSGDVDVSMPTNTKATLKLRSISGEVYTDFDMNLKGQDNMQPHRRPGGGRQHQRRRQRRVVQDGERRYLRAQSEVDQSSCRRSRPSCGEGSRSIRIRAAVAPSCGRCTLRRALMTAQPSTYYLLTFKSSYHHAPLPIPPNAGVCRSGSQSASAQKIIEKTANLTPGQRVFLNLKQASNIRIRAGAGGKMTMKATVSINQNRLNDALQFPEQTGDELKLTADFDKEMLNRPSPATAPTQPTTAIVISNSAARRPRRCATKSATK